MRARISISLALLVLAAASAVVLRTEKPPDPYSEESLSELLRQPLTSGGSSFWRALLDHPSVERTGAGRTLRIGRVLTDPSAACLAAEHSGELLALEAEGPQGKLGVPLWRAVLDGPSREEGESGALRLNGCRHTADPDAGPVIEDTYRARLSLAAALRAHAGAAGGAPLELRGEHGPVKGGANFEVQLVGETQLVEVTFDGHPGEVLRASRSFRPSAPHDARARANLAAALRELAASDASLGTLAIEGESGPAAGGFDVRLETIGTRVSILATREGERLSAYLEVDGSPSAREE